MPQITKEYKFCAAHKYWNNKWDEKKNYEVFGDDIYNHGHNYVLEVTVKGEVDPETGMVLDLKALNKLINEEIINKVDHKNLNIDVDFLKGVIPTAENIAIHIWNILKLKIESGELHEVTLFESERNFVVYHGASIERPN